MCSTCKNFRAIKKPYLDNGSRKLFFVRYSPKGYRLWNAENRKIILSRDVKFEDKIEIKTMKNTKDTRRDEEKIDKQIEEKKREKCNSKEIDNESMLEEY